VSNSKDKLAWTQTDGQPARFRSDGKRTVMSLTKEDVNVVFQPIVELATGRQFAMEALVRCKIPEYERPGNLFARAEMEKACGRLGRVIREVAFERADAKPLFVNIHPDELSSRWLVRPDDPLCFHEGPLYLEITESATFEHYDLCVSVLKEVCSRTGALLVIDDLGAGYSNLKRMLDLRPEIVKLDLTLARDLDKYPRQRTLVTQLVSLCRDLGSEVVIEGVETVEELKAARDTGAEYAQGFVLAMPSFPPPKVSWPL
jgi:EAL domain-containing protein (putative c-di-GMP-specific phosphodiesterase class I)